jgi:hypothetical protein
MRTTPSWLGSLFAYAPQLTRNWGAFRAFVAVFGIAAMVATAARPEVAYFPALIFVVAVAAALIAAHKNWLH